VADRSAAAAEGEVVPIDEPNWLQPSAEGTEVEEVLAGSRLESIMESLLFASDKPLGSRSSSAFSASATARR
jgi:hypothetical protein